MFAVPKIFVRMNSLSRGQLHISLNLDSTHISVLQEEDDDGAGLLRLIHGEVTLEPLEDDHPLHGVPQSSLHRATLCGSVNILSMLLGASKQVSQRGGP